MINRMTNPRPSVFPDKWRFDISQDWEIIGANFECIHLETIPDATLRDLGFHYSPLGYFEAGAPHFIDVTDQPDLAIELEIDGQPITNSEDEKTKKALECATKEKARRNNLYALIWQVVATDPAAPLLSHSPGPLYHHVLDHLLYHYLILLDHLLRYLIFLRPLCHLVFLCPVCRFVLLCPLCYLVLLCPLCRLFFLPALSSSPPIPALSSPPMPALLSHSVLDLALTCFIFSALKIFK